MPDGAPLCLLAEATAAVSLSAAAVAATATAIAAAAEQQEQDDDPAHIATTETTITKVTHNSYLQIFDAVFAAHSMVFRRADFVRLSAFFSFCALCTEVEGNHGCKHRQKILARQYTP